MTTGQRSMPVLRVKDVQVSAEFFCEGLGFSLAGYWRDKSDRKNFAIVRLDDITIGLIYDETPPASQHWVAYLYLSDIDAFADQVLAKGITFLSGPKDSSYQCREIEIAEPSGNVLCFSQDLEPGEKGPGL